MTREADRPADVEHRHQRTAARAPLAPSDALDIQRSAGNSALIQLLRQAGHPWAQEPHQHTAGCGHPHNARAEQPAVQRSTVHDVLRTSGRPLDDATRTDMEARLGADFSDVRVHDDSAARASAAEVGARAYTSGNHVVLGDGGTDRHTLAHELTHVIQQRSGPVAGTDNGDGLKVSDPSDRFEREAEANARRALSGPAPAGPAVAPPVQRTTGGTRLSVQRVPAETAETASSSSAAPTQAAAVPAAPMFGIKISSTADVKAHGLTAENTLVVNAKHSGDMYHVRAALIVNPELRLLMYGLLDDFDPKADGKRITESVKNRRKAEENSPEKIAASTARATEFNQTKDAIAAEVGKSFPPDHDPAAADAEAKVAKWREEEKKRRIKEAMKTSPEAAYRAAFAAETAAEIAAEITALQTNRPAEKRAVDRKAQHMYQLHEDLPGRVFYTKESPRNLKIGHSGETRSTDAFMESMLAKRRAWVGAGGDAAGMQDFHREYAAPDEDTKQAFDAARSDSDHPLSRFRTGVRYVIVNYRDSGHTGEGNAPALDTGHDGLSQLQEMIRTHPDLGGAQPLLIGDFPGPVPTDGPHLHKYWQWPGMTGRRSELALLHYLNEKFTIIGAVGMRSGVTDQFAFAGIKTLSIDISPNQPRPRNGQTVDNETDATKYPSKGWERGGKLEAIFGPRYGRAFLKQERAGDQEVTKGHPWAGPFGEQDQAMLRDAIAHFFAEERSDGGTLATADDFRHFSHPLHPSSISELDESDLLGNDKKRVIHERIAALQAADAEDRKKKGPPTTP
ncbi:DUF4157 domain-containing protein [Streptomyces sp. NPDC053541]|uniref:DUF4157 domain-containing protein n=1 Tax=Streptomyces sp. NPDC053541 TaxID=3365709 RepID=UPI0037D4EF07